MKTIITILLFLSAPILLKAQSSYTYEYSFDAAGNRTLRTCILVSGYSAQSTTSETTQSLKSSESDLQGLTDSLVFSNIAVYPNPNHGQLILHVTNASGVNNATALIYTVSGDLLLKEHVNNGYTRLDFSNIKPGTYILKLIIGDNEKTYKIIRN